MRRNYPNKVQKSGDVVCCVSIGERSVMVCNSACLEWMKRIVICRRRIDVMIVFVYRIGGPVVMDNVFMRD